MNIETLREYCLSKNATSEGFPFDENTLVFKVAGKMFALTSLAGEFRINLKCDPDLALELREQYGAVIPGYHMSKKHWNTVIVDGELEPDQIIEMIDHSYDLVVKSLPKYKQKELLG